MDEMYDEFYRNWYMQRKVHHKQHLQKLYNQNTVVEDSQMTSFAYLKTLALEMMMAIFTVLSMTSVLVNYFFPNRWFSVDKMQMMAATWTVLSIVTLILEKLAFLKWIKEKKDYDFNITHQVLFVFAEILLLLPTPNPALASSLSLRVSDISGSPIDIYIQDLLGAYVLIRSIYLLKFLIHTELFYGSRPDRLSRLYTVKFGTFNAFKFLINQKPHFILFVIFVLNYLFLPLFLLLVEGKINSKLDSFIACVYYQVVTQVTVGYGQIVVVTQLGRVIIVLSIIIGITTTSILLIFFMRLMEQDTSEQESHALLGVLERKKEVAKALVERVETQIGYAGRKVPQEKRQQFMEKLQAFKFKNARKIKYQKQTKPNLKRMMVSNFSALLQGLNDLKETQIMLGKYIKIIQNSYSIKEGEQSSQRLSRQQSDVSI